MAAASPRRRFATAATMAAIIVGSVLLGTGTSYAYWSATTNATGSTTSGDVEVSVGPLTTTSLANHRRSVTFPVTVTNNSIQRTATTLANLSIKMDAVPTNGGFSTAAKVAIWDSAVQPCSTVSPTALADGNWGGTTASGMTIGKSVTKTYCVRTWLERASDAGNSAGTASFTAQITATARVGDLADSESRTVAQSTEWIYPRGSVSAAQWWVLHQGSATGECMDVRNGGASNPNTDVIRWNDCHKEANQQWQFMPASTSGYVMLRPRSTAASGVLVTSGTTVTVQSQTGAANQQWELQQKGANLYQLVSLDTGYCLTAATSGSAMTTGPCSGAATQAFFFEAREPITSFPGNLSCTASTSGNPRTMTLSWLPIGTGYTGTLRVQIYNGEWTTVATVPATASGATVPISGTTYDGGWLGRDFNYRVVDASGSAWGAGTFTMSSSFIRSSQLTGCTP